MRLIELPNPHVHSVCYSLHVDAGSLTDSLNKPGVALLTQRMVLEAEMHDSTRRSPAGRLCNGAVAPAEAFVLAHGHRSRGGEVASLIPLFLGEPTFDEDVLERERAILWDTLPDAPEGSMDIGELVNRLLIRPDLNWSVYGSRGSVGEATLEDVHDRFEECWLDGNIVLSAAGAYDPADLDRCITGVKEALQGREDAPFGPMTDVLSETRKLAIVPVQDDRFSLHLLFPCGPVAAPEARAVQVLDCVVGDGPDSRVRRRLTWESGLADQAGSQLWVLGDTVILEVSVEGSVDRFRDIVKLFVRSVEALLLDLPDADEVDEAETVLRFLRDFQKDDPQIAAPARGSQLFATRFATAGELDAMVDDLTPITAEEVYEVAQRALSWDNLAVLYIGPHTPEADYLLEDTWPTLPIESWEPEA
jgi:predicted Zn-dependent peptidase